MRDIGDPRGSTTPATVRDVLAALSLQLQAGAAKYGGLGLDDACRSAFADADALLPAFLAARNRQGTVAEDGAEDA